MKNLFNKLKTAIKNWFSTHSVAQTLMAAAMLFLFITLMAIIIDKDTITAATLFALAALFFYSLSNALRN